MGECNDLIERLLNPLWAHMRGGEPHLDDEATLADLKEAADTIATLSEALAEAEKKGAEDWRPIETAKAGELLLLFEPHSMGGFIFVGALNGVWFNNLDQKIQQPTMWRPLPAPPRDLSQGDQHG